MELRVGKPCGLGFGQPGTTESVFIQEGNHVVVLGTVGYGKGVDPTAIPEEAKVAQARAALAAAVELQAGPE